jgi:hypothetical protein
MRGPVLPPSRHSGLGRNLHASDAIARDFTVRTGRFARVFAGTAAAILMIGFALFAPKASFVFTRFPA